MKVLVTGGTGQLGYDVTQQLKFNNIKFFAPSRAELDISNEKNVEQYILNLKPDAIIHCAAYTAVDNAEDEKEKCYDINVNATKYISECAKKLNSKLVYISTDYVFDGEKDGAYQASDKTNPINYYGYTKCEGEKIVKSLLQKYFIVRISWVFGQNGNNFVKTMLRLANDRNELSVVSDQIGSPTYTVDLSKLLVEMVKTEKYGIYHATNKGYCTWFEFASEIFKKMNINIKLNKINTSDYPTKAKRPLNSKLSKEKLSKNGFNELPCWKKSLCDFISQINN